MKNQRPYEDLREFLAVLEDAGKLIRITREVNKDTELQPLVRLQFRGLKDEDRKAFLFENVTDSKGRHYDGSVLVGGCPAPPTSIAWAFNAARKRCRTGGSRPWRTPSRRKWCPTDRSWR